MSTVPPRKIFFFVPLCLFRVQPQKAVSATNTRCRIFPPLILHPAYICRAEAVRQTLLRTFFHVVCGEIALGVDKLPIAQWLHPSSRRRRTTSRTSTETTSTLPFAALPVPSLDSGSSSSAISPTPTASALLLPTSTPSEPASPVNSTLIAAISASIVSTLLLSGVLCLCLYRIGRARKRRLHTSTPRVAHFYADAEQLPAYILSPSPGRDKPGALDSDASTPTPGTPLPHYALRARPARVSTQTQSSFNVNSVYHEMYPASLGGSEPDPTSFGDADTLVAHVAPAAEPGSQPEPRRWRSTSTFPSAYSDELESTVDPRWNLASEERGSLERYPHAPPGVPVPPTRVA
ncbi:hypothetical protein MKEN_01018400 [Mycena kentingensis (nom. inval.)]|nr:hypothetical protein MKEN_01018400 [Mycena kentingensis (nom. inval.)]